MNGQTNAEIKNRKTLYILTNNSTIRKLDIINIRPTSIDQSTLPTVWNLADKKKRRSKMPKVVYSASKGLYQESGSGFEIGDVSVVEASETMDDTADTAIAAYGSTLLDSDTAGGAMPSLTLAVNSNVGATKFIAMSAHGGNATVTLSTAFIESNGTTSSSHTLVFSGAGQYAKLISNGSQWMVVSLTAAEA